MNFNCARFTKAIVFGLALASVGCKKGLPEIASLNSSLSGFAVETSKVTTTSTSTPAFDIQGTCTSKFTDVQVSADAGKTWQSVSKVSSTVSLACSSSGKFSASLKFSEGVFNSSKWSSAGVYSDFLVRGSSSLGYSSSIGVEVTSKAPTTDSSIGSFTITGITGNTDLTLDAYLFTTAMPTINWSAATGAASYDVSIRNSGNTVDVCSAQSTTALMLSLSACSLIDGTSYKAVVVAKDSAGKTLAAANSGFDFTVDTTAPLAFAISGASGNLDASADAVLATTLNPTVSWAVSSGASSYSVVIRNNGDTADVCGPETTSSISLTMSNCTLADGSAYKIKITAFDAAGNSVVATNNLFPFTVDNTPPGSFSITGITGGTDSTYDNFLTSGNNATVNWAASSGASSYDVKIMEADGTTVKCALFNVSSPTNTYTFGGCSLTAGLSYYAKVYARDSVGNSIPASNSPFQFSVDTTGPTVTSIDSTDSPGNYIAGSVINIRVHFSEPVSLNGGIMSLALNSGGGGSATASCSSTSGQYLQCTYTVLAPHSANRLDILSSAALTIPGGAYLTDLAGNNASLTLATPGTTGSWDSVQTFKIVGTPADLVISDGATYSYGSVNVGTPTSRGFTLSNNSSYIAATGISGASFANSQFSFDGGSYPGTGGTCSTTLSAGSACVIFVKFLSDSANTWSDTITVNYNNGISTTSTTRAVTGTGLSGPATVTVVPVYQNNGANWNDYVKFATAPPSGTLYNQTDTPGTSACDGTETGYYNEYGGCIHGGELRKVSVTGQSSCNNLQMTDNLGVFNWTCDGSTNPVIFYTSGFASGKGLKDLITSGGTWQPFSVTATLNGSTTVATSTASTTIWNNTITPLPNASSSPQTLTASAIYYVTAIPQLSMGYLISGDKIAIVTLGSAFIKKNTGATAWCAPTTGGTSSATANTMICGGISGAKFLWMETKLDGDNSGYADSFFAAYKWKYSRFHRIFGEKLLATSGAAGGGMAYFAGSIGNLVTGFDGQLAVSGLIFDKDATSLAPSSYNTVRDVRISNLGGAGKGGLKLTNSANHNRFYDISISNGSSTTNGVGINLDLLANANTFQRVRISNMNGSTSGGNGIYLGGGTNTVVNNIFTQVAINNVFNAGVNVFLADSNVFHHLTTTNATSNGIYMSGTGVNGNSFSSWLNLGSDKGLQTQTISGSGNQIINMASAFNNSGFIAEVASGTGLNISGYLLGDSLEGCAVLGAISNSDCTGSGTTITTVSGWANAIVGPVASDTTNPYTSGSVTWSSNLSVYTNAAAFDRWNLFDNFFRGWGIDLSLGSANGFCSSTGTGVCRIWDLRAKSTGPAYNVSYNGTSTNANGNGGIINTDGAACVANTVVGTDTITGPNSIIFLKNAVEIDGDRIGNDNGLCEAGENCLWAPNIGAYQGSGSISTGFCTVSGGIKIYKYTTN